MSRDTRIDRLKTWPIEVRPHYIRLFSLQERLRAHLKMAQQLARKNYESKHSDGSPRKSGSIRIVSRSDDYLKKYREDQWPDIKHYLSRMRQEIQEIKTAYKGGRPPKWHEQIAMVETLTEQILEKMEMIQAHLIITLRSSPTIKESNLAIINETAKVIIMARDLREVLTFVPLDQAKVGHDDYGFEAIIDLTEQHTIDFTKMTIWHQNQNKTNKRG